MQDFHKLKVWEKAHQVALAVYQVTRTFPKDELYGLTSQIRRASAPIASNIAEGCSRGSDADFCRFLQIALGSAAEVEYEFLLAKDLNYLPANDYTELNSSIIEIKRMLTGLIQKIRTNKKTENY
jgi:four helix bundle protein